jgi:hypothetical protein
VAGDKKKKPADLDQAQKEELTRRGLWFVAGGVGLVLVAVGTLYRLGGLAAGFEYTVVTMVLGVCGVIVASRGTKLIEAARHIHREESADQKGVVTVELEHNRWNNFGWGLFLLAISALFITRFGITGKSFALLFVAFGIRNGYRFVQTLLRPPGRILVEKTDVELPRGLCRDNPVQCKRADVKHAFMLRRSVPWGRTGPVLVVELDNLALVYPRNWFHSDADQERIALALTAEL